MQQPRVEVLLQSLAEPLEEGFLQGTAPLGPALGKRFIHEPLEEPNVGIVETEPPGRGIAGFGSSEALEVGLPHHVQVPIRQTRRPELQDPAGSLVLVSEGLPGASARNDPQIHCSGVPMSSEMPAFTHAERPVVGIKAPDFSWKTWGESIRASLTSCNRCSEPGLLDFQPIKFMARPTTPISLI